MMLAHIQKFQSTSEVCEKCSKKFAYFNQRKNCGNCMKALCSKHLHQKMYLYHKYRALHENSSKREDVIDERGEKIKQTPVCSDCYQMLIEVALTQTKLIQVRQRSSPMLDTEWSSSNCCWICNREGQSLFGFGLINSMHHCRNCERTVCARHCRRKRVLYHRAGRHHVRVCDKCDDFLDEVSRKASANKAMNTLTIENKDYIPFYLLSALQNNNSVGIMPTNQSFGYTTINRNSIPGSTLLPTSSSIIRSNVNGGFMNVNANNPTGSVVLEPNNTIVNHSTGSHNIHISDNHSNSNLIRNSSNNIEQQQNGRKNNSYISQGDYLESEEAIGRFIASTGIEGGAHNITSPSFINTSIPYSASQNISNTSSSNTSPITTPPSMNSITPNSNNVNNLTQLRPQSLSPTSTSTNTLTSTSSHKRRQSDNASLMNGGQSHNSSNNDESYLIQSLPVPPSAPVLPLAPNGQLLNIPPVEAYLVDGESDEYEVQENGEIAVQGYSVPG